MNFIPHFLRRLRREDLGQDLVEYALLALLFGVVGAAVFPIIVPQIGTVFGDWGTAVYNAWEPDDPATP